MSVKEIKLLKRVQCPFYIENGCTVEHCEKCTFNNGIIKNDDDEVIKVECLYSELPQFGCHVTEFTMNGMKYRVRYYDEEIDGPITGDDPYDFCQKCCFNKLLENGNYTCLLRTGVGDDIEKFTCYDGEIWIETPDIQEQ